MCGTYRIDALEELDARVLPSDKRAIASGVLCRATLEGRVTDIEEGGLPGLLARGALPTSPLDAMEQILLDVATAAIPFGASAQVPFTAYARYFLRNDEELRFLLELADSEQLVSQTMQGSYWDVRPTMDGWRRVAELRRTRVDTWQAFVAMAFAPEHWDTYRFGIYPALRDTGYVPFRVDQSEHNGKIDDRIFAELRRSGLVVADFSGQRQAVYYEAGFAGGLGTNVIWCAPQAEVDGNKLAFDTRQYSHVTWSTTDELRRKLTARIEATIPFRKPLPEVPADPGPWLGARNSEDETSSEDNRV